MKRGAALFILIIFILTLGAMGLIRVYDTPGEILGGSPFNWYECQNYEEIEEANDLTQQRLAKKYYVFVNGILVDLGYEWDNVIHVPIRTVGSSLNWEVNWIAEMGVIQLVKGQEESYVDIVNFFGRAYVDLKRLENLLHLDKVQILGANIEISDYHSQLEVVNIPDVEKICFYINGMKMTEKAVNYNNKKYIPVKTFAQSYARGFRYNALLGEAYIDDRRVEGIFVDGQAYATPEEIQKIIDTGDDRLEFKEQLVVQEAVPVIYKGPPKKVIALTFDDYLGDQVVELLDVLEKNQVKGTFFLIGNGIEGYSYILKDLAQRGHEVANHTWDHYNGHTLSDDELRAQLIANQLMIDKYGGGQSRFYRPPGGFYNQRIISIAQDIGLKTVLWSLNSTDANPSNGPRGIKKTVTRWVQPGSIIVMHTNRKHTIMALPDIIQSLKRRGYSFVTLSEMFKTTGKGSH